MTSQENKVALETFHLNIASVKVLLKRKKMQMFCIWNAGNCHKSLKIRILSAASHIVCKYRNILRIFIYLKIYMAGRNPNLKSQVKILNYDFYMEWIRLYKKNFEHFCTHLKILWISVSLIILTSHHKKEKSSVSLRKFVNKNSYNSPWKQQLN